MMQKSKLAIAQLLNDPMVRVALILGTLILAALAGAAPHDFGGA